MTKGIIIAVVCGISAGYFIVPALPFGQTYIAVSGNVMTVTLCALLFLVGIEVSRNDKIIEEVKTIGPRILLFPLAAILGTYVFSAVASLFLPMTFREAMAAGGGFGWYSFAPGILLPYSANLSAICFLQNIIREVLGIILIPFAAHRVGYIEAVTLPGVSAMDVCLPIIEKSTGSHITIYAITIGLSMGLVVPLVGLFVGL